MWARAMRGQSAISLAHKKFRLALEMLLSDALWQLVTILRTYFTASHTRLSTDRHCELIRGLQQYRRKRKDSVPFVPTSKEKKSVTFFI
jgi:hypothetical protein